MKAIKNQKSPQDDYCSYLKSRWKEKPCTSTAKLSIGEIMACVKTTFDDEKEGKKIVLNFQRPVSNESSGNFTNF